MIFTRLVGRTGSAGGYRTACLKTNGYPIRFGIGGQSLKTMPTRVPVVDRAAAATAKGEMPIEQAIQEYRFAYGANRAAVLMDAPPCSLALTALSDPVANLFERAFSRNSSRASERPTAATWLQSLTALEQQVKRCPTNGSHYFFKDLPRCPWCEIEGASGSLLFNVHVPFTINPGQVFEINIVWRRIENVPRPASIANEPSAAAIHGIESDAALRDQARQRRVRKFLGISATVFCAAILANVVPEGVWYWLLAAGCACIALGRVKGQEFGEYKARLKSAEALYETARKAYFNGRESDTFDSKIRQLKEARESWLGLNEKRNRRYAELQANRERQQLKRFLESAYIERAAIPGVGPERKAMLQSYNIDTAWDVTESNIDRVPGFGRVTISKLMAWRQSVQRRFRFDPTKPIDPGQIAALDQEISSARASLEKQLLSGVGELMQIAHQRTVQCAALHGQLGAALRSLLQAKADLRAVS